MTAHTPEPGALGPEAAVKTMMTRAVARISPDARLDEIAQKLAAVEAGALAVGTTDSVVGVVSERDLTRAYGLNEHADALRAADIASDQLIWCEPDATATEAARVMCDHGVRHLLVGDAESRELSGIVSARDLIQALIAS